MIAVGSVARDALAVVLLAGVLGSTGALAQSTGSHSAHGTSPAGAPAAMTDGVVRKIDKEAGKITLKHEPIANLDMSAMTMVFRVTDPAMLESVKVGDAVRFTADSIGGQLTVTRIEKAP